MKILGILGSHQRDGLNAQLLEAILHGASIENETELLFLNDYQITPETDNPNSTLDLLEKKLQEADVWVVVSPTYWSTISGVLKNFFDCMRPRMIAYNRKGEMIPAQFAKKRYISVTSCFVSTRDNLLNGATDNCFKTIDKILTTAGLEKIQEIVCTDTIHLEQIPVAKREECEKAGRSIQNKTKRDDYVVKRYAQLFGMIAVMALITMGIQLLFGIGQLNSQFWIQYLSFVLIFYVLLSAILHFFTVQKHKRH